MVIQLSTTSQDLISQLSKKNLNLTTVFQQQTSIERQTLLNWFETVQHIIADEEIAFLIASLNASLLKDFKESINPSKPKKKEKPTSWRSKAKYVLLAIAGTLYFGCEGFDGVTAIMGAFSAVPTIAIFAVGTLFSVLSIIVFYSFDLVEISKNLGVKKGDTPKLLDVLLDEFQQIKAIRYELSKPLEKTQQQLEEDKALAVMLLKRHEALNEARDKLKKALNNPYLNAAKMATAAVAGIIFFSGGFFAGQTVALAVAGLFFTSVAATFWPVLLASVVIGLAAFSVYWFVERPGIENLISRWKGLDKEKIDALCKSKVVDRETEKLQILLNNIEEKINALKDNAALKGKNNELTQTVVNLESENGGLLQEVKNLQAQLASLQQSLVGVKPNQTEASNDVIAGIEPVGSLQYSANQTFFGQAPVLRKTKSLSDLLSRKVVEQPLEKTANGYI
ncbi:hypothetical protein [Legionella jamestowniensis]|uniref:Coiled-coil protein n=1 Tax=Legionella jamestowniensis TaxID=455 RepID=A0A0W0UHW9_9GAMM|nr:hypothetical protein [Legionella jamestowniensis]KTD07499.1 coiled-coil protein [Legionella jamestowniensis]OCH97727.1 hypothetical protein A8135_02500 [Legionella jamestowniensis]SFM00928.1 hypothetical protein SAMN02746073_3023 [Legionella jamestowniensis DSM 19215]